MHEGPTESGSFPSRTVTIGSGIAGLGLGAAATVVAVDLQGLEGLLQ